MLCENCKKNNANTHIKQVINGEAREYMLCHECAAKLGYADMLSPFSMSIGDMLGSVFGDFGYSQSALPDTLRCKGCGASFDDIRSTGMAGCAECYTTFYDELIPSLQRIHGQTEHIGKVASSAGSRFKLKNEIKAMKKELKQAVAEQNFEKAASLRDKIKELEASEAENHE